ncbi:MAG: putative DCC family thiol-disulfide oxidoreductase YuxK [Bacteroidia bacterium]|jgi:predicted DCC family thiol-disulfide oxidoreductase YuxK
MKLETFSRYPNIILFDGVCDLCSRSVHFIIKNDPHKKFKFASLQSDFSKSLLNSDNRNELSSIIYFQNGNRFDRSTAALFILKELHHPLRFFHNLSLVPAFLRDPFYNLIAASRYSIFGKRDSCMVPSVEIKGRFIQSEE